LFLETPPPSLSLPSSSSSSSSTSSSSSSSSFVPSILSRYPFDAVYDSSTFQSSFYSFEIHSLVSLSFSGHISTIFTFGMSGTGKSHTLMGSKGGGGRGNGKMGKMGKINE